MEKTRWEFPSQTNRQLAAVILRKRFEIEEDQDGITMLGSTPRSSQAYELVRHLGAVEITTWGKEDADEEEFWDTKAGLNDGW